MFKIASLPIAGALLACGLSAAPAQAGPNRTWVSGMGTGLGFPEWEPTGARARAPAPCRTFAFALTQTAAGGEIDVLDPAGYDYHHGDQHRQRRRRRRDHRDFPGHNAGAGDSVHLRGLTVRHHFHPGRKPRNRELCHPEFCKCRILISPSTSSSFSVSNTIASNNFGGAEITIMPTGAAIVKGVLSKVTTNNNNN
jgi:hypothetical protein